MKKPFLLAVVLFLANIAFAGDPTPAVLSAFQKTFQHSVGVKWHAEDEGFTAFFVQDNISHHITYDKSGNIVSGIRYYDKEHLPFVVRAKIQKRFQGKSIYGVAELTANNETVYEIYLQDERTLMTVQSDAYANLVLQASYKRVADSKEHVHL